MTDTRPDGCTDHEHAELLTLFQVTTAELDRVKRWAWCTTVYCVVALLAVYGLYVAEVQLVERTDDEAFFFRILCTELMFIALVYGGAYLYFNGRLVKRHRKRLKRCRRAFSERFRQAHGRATPVSAWPMFIVIVIVFTFFLVLMWRGAL